METNRPPVDARFVIGLVVAALGGMGLLGSLVFLLLGGIFSAVFPAVFGTPFEDVSLDREGATCPGVLLRAEPNPGLVVSNQPTVRLFYRYEPPTGPREDDVLVVQSDAMASHPLGSAVTVEYLPATPDVSRIQGTRAALAGWAGAIGLGFGALGIVLVVFFGTATLAGALVAFRARKRSLLAVRSGERSI